MPIYINAPPTYLLTYIPYMHSYIRTYLHTYTHTYTGAGRGNTSVFCKKNLKARGSVTCRRGKTSKQTVLGSSALISLGLLVSNLSFEKLLVLLGLLLLPTSLPIEEGVDLKTPGARALSPSLTYTDTYM
jgi:hypothetical protein